MKLRFSLLFAFCACLLSAEAPNLSGVWKANIEKSKFAGNGAPSSYLMIVEQKDTRITGQIGMMTPRGEQRTSFTYNTARPGINSVRGIPMRAKSSWEGNALVVEEHVGGAHPADIHEKYILASDGNTLTLESKTTMGTQERAETIVFEKQPDSAGEALRKPQETAAAHYKNIKVLKDIPASQLFESMRYFAFALGVECQFCHVEGNFAADDKRTKETARHMIARTQSINQANFNGRSQVQCYTCHSGHEQPRRLPE
jgi:hypothetical protein